MEHEEALDIDKMVVNINWAGLVNRLTSTPSDFRIELRIAKTEKAKKLDVLHNKPEEIADFFTGQVKSLHVRRKPDHYSFACTVRVSHHYPLCQNSLHLTFSPLNF